MTATPIPRTLTMTHVWRHGSFLSFLKNLSQEDLLKPTVNLESKIDEVVRFIKKEIKSRKSNFLGLST